MTYKSDLWTNAWISRCNLGSLSLCMHALQRRLRQDQRRGMTSCSDVTRILIGKGGVACAVIPSPRQRVAKLALPWRGRQTPRRAPKARRGDPKKEEIHELLPDEKGDESPDRQPLVLGPRRAADMDCSKESATGNPYHNPTPTDHPKKNRCKIGTGPNAVSQKTSATYRWKR